MTANITDWIGNEETSTVRMDGLHAQMVTATLPGAEPVRDGDVMPALWHWTAFRPDTPTQDLGPDGHPKLGGFLPETGLPRRMWAGGALRFRKPLHLGERLTRHSRVANVVEKTGGTGRMVFVTVEHTIAGEAGVAVEETQDIVYLPMLDSFRAPKPVAVPDAPDHQTTVEMSPALLFRFSACTFNSHRIHYDLPYATEVEKYPGLVVHGPLQAMLLMQMATRIRGRAPTSFRFRGVSPMFHDHDLHLMATEQPDGLHLCTAKETERQGLQAVAKWEE